MNRIKSITLSYLFSPFILLYSQTDKRHFIKGAFAGELMNFLRVLKVLIFSLTLSKILVTSQALFVGFFLSYCIVIPS